MYSALAEVQQQFTRSASLELNNFFLNGKAPCAALLQILFQTVVNYAYPVAGSHSDRKEVELGMTLSSFGTVLTEDKSRVIKFTLSHSDTSNLVINLTSEGWVFEDIRHSFSVHDTSLEICNKRWLILRGIQEKANS